MRKQISFYTRKLTSYPFQESFSELNVLYDVRSKNCAEFCAEINAADSANTLHLISGNISAQISVTQKFCTDMTQNKAAAAERGPKTSTHYIWGKCDNRFFGFLMR